MGIFFAFVAIFVSAVVVYLLYSDANKKKKLREEQNRQKEKAAAHAKPVKEPEEESKIDQDYFSFDEEDSISAKGPTDVFESREISKKVEISAEDAADAVTPASDVPVVISTRSRTSGARASRYFSVFSTPKTLEIRVKRNYFTRGQAAKYAERSGSSRLERALSQEMLLVNLYTDTVTIPHRAEATVYSLHSGLQYQTSLTQCSCPDHQKTNAPCKHMLALALHVGAIELKK